MQAAADPVAFRAVLDSVFAAPAYRWVEEPGLFRLLREWWHRLGDWLHGLQAGNPAVFRLALFGMLVLLFLIFLHAAYVTYRTVHGAVAGDDTGPQPSRPTVRDAAWYRREADRAAGEGRLLEALQLAFVALALTLEVQGVLRYQMSMTPAECVAAAQVVDDDRARLRRLVGVLYAHVFGGRPCAMDDYLRWRNASEVPWHATPR